MGGNDDGERIARLEERMKTVETAVEKIAEGKQTSINNTIAVIMVIAALFQTFTGLYSLQTMSKQSKQVERSESDK